MEIFEEFFVNQGYRKLQLNVSGISVFLKNKERSDDAVILFHMPQGNEWTKEQCVHIEQQLMDKLRLDRQHSLAIVTFLLTQQPDAVRAICRENDHTGVIDLREKRLLLFEGMANDKLGIYEGLEDLLGAQKQNTVQEVLEQAKYRPSKPTLFSRLKTVGIVTLSMVFINVVVFIVLMVQGIQHEVVEQGSLFWYAIDQNKEYYRLFTSMFLHVDLEHLLYNMLTLGAIGNTLERIIGSVKYVFVYILSGIVAGLVSMRYNMEKEILVQSIGASGAIFGVIGALLIVVLMNKGKVDNLGNRQMLLFVALSLYSGFKGQGVDNMAHVGGLIAGIILALILYRKPRKRGVVS